MKLKTKSSGQTACMYVSSNVHLSSEGLLGFPLTAASESSELHWSPVVPVLLPSSCTRGVHPAATACHFCGKDNVITYMYECTLDNLASLFSKSDSYSYITYLNPLSFALVIGFSLLFWCENALQCFVHLRCQERPMNRKNPSTSIHKDMEQFWGIGWRTTCPHAHC